MGQQSMLARKNEILKRRISRLIIRENSAGLNTHEHLMKQKFLREYHENCYQMNDEPQDK